MDAFFNGVSFPNRSMTGVWHRALDESQRNEKHSFFASIWMMLGRVSWMVHMLTAHRMGVSTSYLHCCLFLLSVVSLFIRSNSHLYDRLANMRTLGLDI
jgi:hypothetical protein